MLFVIMVMDSSDMVSCVQCAQIEFFVVSMVIGF